MGSKLGGTKTPHHRPQDNPNLHAEVFSEKIQDNGRRFVFRYYGLYESDVTWEVNKVMKNIDKYRSAKASPLYTWGAFKAIDVTFYGLD